MIEVEVMGVPRPGGSKTPGLNKRTGKQFVRDANPLTATWRADVQVQAMQQYKGPLLNGPISMNYYFRFPRPKWHFGTGKNSQRLKPSAPPLWHITKPDLTKIIRSTEDALTGIVWTDDCRVCMRTEDKRYCAIDERPGVYMQIWEMA